MSDETPGEVCIRPILPTDMPTIRNLHARAFGPGRFARTAYRVREGLEEISPFCRAAVTNGRLVAAVKYTPIVIGQQGGALLLGPLAVDPSFASRGYGRGLVAQSLEEARDAGIALVVLVGDEPYYARLGFRRVPYGQILLPGPVDPNRLLAVELSPNTLEGYSGMTAAATP